MNKMLVIFILVTVVNASADATCPPGWEEVPMENTVLTSDSCPAGTTPYYHIDNMCSAHVL